MNMKLIFSAFAACCLITPSLLAQGRVNFNNSSATPITITSTWFENDGTPHYGPTNVLGTASTATFGVGPASARVWLYAGSTSSSLMPVLIGTGANLPFVTNSASTVAAAQGTFTGGGNLPLLGFAGGTPVYLQCRVENINGLYMGFTPIIQVIPATGSDPATPLFGSSPGQWGGVIIGYPELFPAPEPATITLLGLGFSAVAFARQRRRQAIRR